MGVELVEGSDLVVTNGHVAMRTTKGFERVDVLYRRIDDDFLDPQVFRADSLLGIPGLMEVYKKGRIALANAPGTGIADDKCIYAYVPKIIKYYLGEEIIIPNVPTYVCADEKERAYVVSHLDQLVVKAVNESGGYGMLVGPHATCRRTRRVSRADRASTAQLYRAADPRSVAGAGDCRWSFRRTPRRFAPVHSLWQGYLCASRRTDPRRSKRRIAGGQFLPGRRQQRHLGFASLIIRPEGPI